MEITDLIQYSLKHFICRTQVNCNSLPNVGGTGVAMPQEELLTAVAHWFS